MNTRNKVAAVKPRKTQASKAAEQKAQTHGVASLKYAERLLMSDTAREEKEVHYQVKETQLGLQSDILSTEKALAQAESELWDLTSKFPLNARLVIETQVEIEGLKDGLSRLQKLESDLF